MNKVEFSDIVSFDNKAILDAFKEIITAYDEMIKAAKKSASELAASANATGANSDANKQNLEAMLEEMKLLQAQTKSYQKTLESLEAQNKKLQEQNDEKAKAEKAEIDRLKAIEDLSKQRSKAFEKEFAARQKAHDKAKEEAEIMGRQAKSIADLAKQTAILARQRREMDIASDPKRFKELTAAIDANNKKLKEFDGDVGNFQRNVGNYQSAWEGMPGTLGATGQAVGGLGQAVGGLGQSFKALLANPIVALFAALAAVLGALVNAFMKTERGAALLRKGTAFLDATMSKIIDISNDLADAIVFAFEKPKEALSNIGKWIKEYVTNRIENAFGLFKNFGSFVSNVWAGDMDKAAESAKNFGKNVLDAVTMGAGKAVLDGVTNLSKEVNATADAFEKLAEQQLANEKLNQRLSLSIEKLRVEEQLLIDTADNSRLNFTERTKAAEEYAVVAQKRAEQTLRLANANVSIIQKELDLNKNNAVKTRELTQSLTDAKLAQIQAEGEILTTRRDSLEKILTLESDDFEQRLDYVKDYGDAFVAANQAEINLATTTAEKRKALLLETQSYIAANWQQQKAIIEAQAKAAGGQIDLEAMLAEKDAAKVERMAEQAKLDEIGKNRVLQTLAARRASLSSLAALEQTVTDKAKADQKAAFDAEKLAFDKKQELKRAELEGSKRTAEQKAKAEIELQIESYEKQLELANQYPGQIADAEIAIIKQNLANAKQGLQQESQGFDLFALLGFTDSKDGKLEKMKQMFADTVNAVTSFFNQMADARVEAANKAVEASKTEVDNAQSYFDEQQRLKEQGLASDADTAASRLQIAKEAQAKALTEQEKAQKKKAQIESISQTISLISAVANIWKTATELGPIGFVLAGIQTAAMFGSFLLAKKTAKDSTKVEYSEGGTFDIGGGTHKSGNDTLIATTGGVQRRAERNEKVGILNPRAARKYGRNFEQFITLANADMLSLAMTGSVNTNQSSRDYTNLLSEQNGHLSSIAKKNGTRIETFVSGGYHYTQVFKDGYKTRTEKVKLN